MRGSKARPELRAGAYDIVSSKISRVDKYVHACAIASFLEKPPGILDTNIHRGRIESVDVYTAISAAGWISQPCDLPTPRLAW